MYKANYCVLDVETGGTDCLRNPITQLAAIWLDGLTFEEIDRYESFVYYPEDLNIPELAPESLDNKFIIEKAALDYSGIKPQDIEGGVSVTQLVKDLIEINKKHKPRGRGGETIFVGQNFKFDFGFLEVAFKLCNKEISDYFNKTYIDTLILSKIAFAEELQKGENTSLKLKDICARFGIAISQAHDAMGDTEATKEVFLKFANMLSGNLRISNNNNSQQIESQSDRSRSIFRV